MYYDVNVIENPAYEGIMIYKVTVKYNIFCGVILAGDTLSIIMVRYKWKLLLAKRFGYGGYSK